MGLVQLPVWGYVAVTLLLTQITIAAVTLYLHRHQTHRALGLHPMVSHFFRCWLWLTTGMVTQQWVAVHRKHHAHCETPADPHSPQIRGIAKVLFAGAVLYKREASNQATLRDYGQGTPDDWLERNLYKSHSVAGLVLMGMLNLALFGIGGLLIFAVQMAWIPIWAAGVINGLGHYGGYRNFETEDASRNLTPFGLWIGGEELHNNHHAYPQSARFSAKRWEFDIGWLYIRLLQLVGLATVQRLPRPYYISRDKRRVDLETVRTLLHNRYYILKLYSRQVVRPVLRAELSKANQEYRRLLRKVRKPLTYEGLCPSIKANSELFTALERSDQLATVYRLKQQLKQLWTRSTTDQANRLQRLQAWCAEAEQSGIQALQQFAASLPRYTLQTA